MGSIRSSERAHDTRKRVDISNAGKTRAKAGKLRLVDSSGALYANALAIEREAEARYRELAAHMADCGNDTVADLFARLADFEGEHAYHLARKSHGVTVPTLAPSEYAWLDSGSPVPEARAFVLRMMTPHMALEIALEAEVRAKAFFDRIGAESHDPSVQELAREFAQDEAAHIAWVRDAMAGLAKPYQPSEDRPGDPAIEQSR